MPGVMAGGNIQRGIVAGVMAGGNGRGNVQEVMS